MRDALIELGIDGVTVSEVKMLGRRSAHTDASGSSEYVIDFVPKLKLELVVVDNRVGRTIQAIVRKAHTGKFGDGKVFFVPVQEVVRIRTEERGESAV